MRRNRPAPQVERLARPTAPDILAQDPLLARLAAAENEARQHIAGARLRPSTARPTERQRKDALVTLANLDFAISALRGASAEMRSVLDERLTAHRALDAYHRAGTLSDLPVRR